MPADTINEMTFAEVVPGYVFTVENFLSIVECEQFVALSENEGFDAAPITTARGMIHRPDIRNNERVMLDSPDLAALLFERVRPFVSSPIRNREAIGLNERLRFYRYDVGQKFAPHLDGSFRRENGEESQLTFMVYLNDDFSGGETNFFFPAPVGTVRVVPKRGMALLFVHRVEHEGASVLEGRKYVLRSDVMYSTPSI